MINKLNMTAVLYPDLDRYVAQLIEEANTIPAERKKLLTQLSSYIKSKSEETVALNFICTHNSRRSHLAQIWAAVAAHYYGLDQIQTYSGGTEATAFNPRAVEALKRSGFQIRVPEGDNPHYLVSFNDDQPPLECWSKTFDDPVNPSEDFAAIMTCSHADENCPFIVGAKLRLPLTYEDPKEADDTPEETARYDERVRQIGRELFFAMQLVGNQI